LFKEELQKVKAYIATNNTYGVDLNPTAIELGKLSLWLNVIHKDMETPFFSNRLAVGNAVVGAWLKVYKEKDLLEETEVIKDAKGNKKEYR
jgi:type II restriction/modification system DNA methylase subunit YeeA